MATPLGGEPKYRNIIHSGFARALRATQFADYQGCAGSRLVFWNSRQANTYLAARFELAAL
ncbi:MAG TPA: hypothetical protein VKB90_13365 [Candidatus Acidoferrum sp.]|nr:hypothetical protein [Candidatus Acidoferrum sp.]